MPIGLEEEFVPLARAAQLIPGRPHCSSIWRWVRRGVKGHRLEAISVGGRTFTTRQAIERFLDALNCARSEPPQPERPVRPVRQRQIAAAETVLRQARIQP